MKILIEGGRLSSRSFTGIGNVMAQALIAWADASPNDELIVLTYAPLNAELAEQVRLRSNICVQIDPVPVWVPAGAKNAFWFYFRLPALVRRLRGDLYWASSSLVPFRLPSSLRVLLTVYDLVPVLYPKTMRLKGRIISALSYRYSIRRADVLWTISEYTRSQMQQQLPESRGKPSVVACAIDHTLFKPEPTTDDERRRLLATLVPSIQPGPTLLFVGTTEPRKNLGFLLSLMPTLAQDGINLVVVGGKGWGEALPPHAVAIASDKQNRIHFAGRLTNNELAQLYRVVDLFVSTSLDEGFCMPAVEAMACGTPVVLAKNSAMTEVVGIGGVCIASYDKNHWVTGIRRLLDQHPRYQPTVQASKYRWDTAIVKIINLTSVTKK